MNDSYSKLLYPKTGPFRIVEIFQSTETMDEDGISNSVFIDDITLASTLIIVQDVIDDPNNGNRHGLPPTEGGRKYM